MAIQKPIDINNTGVVCEIWRVDNVPVFRSAAIIRVLGWLNLAHYDGDTKKVNSIQFKEYQVIDCQGSTNFTDYFSDTALLEKDASPLKNGYEYLATLPEFEDGVQV